MFESVQGFLDFFVQVIVEPRYVLLAYSSDFFDDLIAIHRSGLDKLLSREVDGLDRLIVHHLRRSLRGAN
jgi:hypothetical protein